MSSKAYYQIDRRPGSQYHMIRATSAIDALRQHLGECYEDWKIVKARINGNTVTTATCPEETAEYYEVARVNR